MDIDGVEDFFNVSFQPEPGSVIPDDMHSCRFEKGGMKYELILSKSRSTLYINADPNNISGNATPAIELNVKFNKLEFEKYEGIEKGMMFIWKGEKQNLYISRLKDAYSISFSCNTPNKSLNRIGAKNAPPG